MAQLAAPSRAPSAPPTSPPTARVTQVLKALANAPVGGYGLSELSRRAGVTKATCLAIAQELASAGYVSADAATKRYRLGPALVALGQAAARGSVAVELARAGMARLSGRFDMAATATAVAGDHIVVLARSGPHRPGDPPARVGRRYPYSPPWSFSHVAWGSDEQIEAWLARPPLFPVALDRARLDAVVSWTRRHGYLVEMATEIAARTNTLIEQLADEPVSDEALDAVGRVVDALGYREFLTEVPTPGRRYEVSMVVAPVHDAAGAPELVVALMGRRTLTGGELRDMVDALLAMTGEVTAAIGGHAPQPRPGGDRP